MDRRSPPNFRVTIVVENNAEVYSLVFGHDSRFSLPEFAAFEAANNIKFLEAHITRLEERPGPVRVLRQRRSRKRPSSA